MIFQLWIEIYGFYLVMKCFAINWASSSSSSGWITSLDHKIRNNSMENQSIVISSTTQFCEISARVRRMIPIQFDGQGTHGRLHVDKWRLPVFWRNTGHLEKIQWIDFLFIWIFYQWRRIFGDRNPRTRETVNLVRWFLLRDRKDCCRSATFEERWETFEKVSRLPSHYCYNTVEVWSWRKNEKNW